MTVNIMTPLKNGWGLAELGDYLFGEEAEGVHYLVGGNLAAGVDVYGYAGYAQVLLVLADFVGHGVGGVPTARRSSSSS